MTLPEEELLHAKLIIVMVWTQTEQEDDEDERYYWDREPEENTSVTTQTQLWHQAHWMGTKAVEGTVFARASPQAVAIIYLKMFQGWRL